MLFPVERFFANLESIRVFFGSEGCFPKKKAVQLLKLNGLF
jgi:hypothetical protein